MSTVHCIPGLGADHRIFQKLDIPGATLQPVPWPYFDRHDEMACYAQKVAALIPEGPEHIILGVSFGGMLATEILRTRPGSRVIIVSSAKSPAELPPVSGFIKFLGRNRLMPTGLTRFAGNEMMKRFGAHTEDEKALLKDILDKTDGHFANCALKAMIEWKAPSPPPGIIHIHGTADKMLLPEYVRPSYWIEGGEHIMVYSRAAEVSALITQHIS